MFPLSIPPMTMTLTFEPPSCLWRISFNLLLNISTWVSLSHSTFSSTESYSSNYPPSPCADSSSTDGTTIHPNTGLRHLGLISFHSFSPSLSTQRPAPVLTISEIHSHMRIDNTTALVQVFILFLIFPSALPSLNTHHSNPSSPISRIICLKQSHLKTGSQKSDQVSGHDKIRSSCQNVNQLHHWLAI